MKQEREETGLSGRRKARADLRKGSEAQLQEASTAGEKGHGKKNFTRNKSDTPGRKVRLDNQKTTKCRRREIRKESLQCYKGIEQRYERRGEDEQKRR